MWFPLVQADLDAWAHNENHHRVRKQAEKVLPSGGTRAEFYRHPERFGAEQSGIPVDMNVVDRLLDEALQAGGEDLMRHIDEELEREVIQAYTEIGEPAITLETAWHIVKGLVEHLIVA